MAKSYPVWDTWKKKAKKRLPVSGSVWWLRGPAYKAPVDTPTPGSVNDLGAWEQLGWIDQEFELPVPVAEVQDSVIFPDPERKV